MRRCVWPSGSSEDGMQASVLDLRSLAPLDRAAVLACARHCSRVLIVHEDSRTGGIGESLAAIIQEEAFELLDAPVRILGALDTPVPYSPPLEAAFLPSEHEIETAARLLMAMTDGSIGVIRSGSPSSCRRRRISTLPFISRIRVSPSS